MDKERIKVLNRLLLLKNNKSFQLVVCGKTPITDKKGNTLDLIKPLHKEWGNLESSHEKITDLAGAHNFTNFGIATGPFSDYLEVIDVDLKVFNTSKEKESFSKEFFSMLEDNIDNLYSKVAVYETKSGGYHLLYKASNCEGNQKLAKPKDNKEASIETRGGKREDGVFKSGYVNFYPDFYHKGLTYEEIKYISDSDRDCIIQCCKALSYERIPEKIKPEKTHKNEITGDSTWNDFNNRNDIWDLISDEFEVIRNLSDKIIIRRHGASSAMSGYIYKDSGCLYLFSTGTDYPAEELLSPFAVFTYKHHGGDFSASAKDLYSKGFGERLTAPKLEIALDEPEEEPTEEDNVFPVEVFSEDVQRNFQEHNKALGLNIDFMSCGLLWSASVLMGNNYKLKIKNGYYASSSLWLACVAKAGVGKSPAINASIRTLEKINTKEVKHYKKQFDKYEAYCNKSKEEQKLCSEVKKPVNGQFIMNDTSLEALTELHGLSPGGIGVYKDELAGWILDMNKYRGGAGGDETFWLSSFDGKSFTSNRKSTGVTVIDKPHIPVIGGIQPMVLTEISGGGNKQDSGFMDRMLFSYPNAEPQYLNFEELDQSVVDWMEKYIEGLYSEMRRFTQLDHEGEVVTSVCSLTPEAKTEFLRVHKEYVDMMKSEDYNERIKSAIPKLLTYLGRFSLICHYLNPGTDHQKVEVQSVLNAEKLVKYFVRNTIRILKDRKEAGNIKTVLDQNRTSISPVDKIAAIIKSGVKFKNTELAEELGISRQHVGRIIKQLKNV